MRTPMSTMMGSTSISSGPSKHESILREASNLRMLERGQTPLLGGENPILEETTTQTAGDDDSKPAARPTTPGGPRAPTPARRDQFGLNRPPSELRGSGSVSMGDDSASVGGSSFASNTNMSIRELAREERRATKRARKQLEEALAALPDPQYEYELEAPMDVDDVNDEKKVETVMEEDAADLEAAERRRLQQEADKLYEARSSVVKRSELPRPVGEIPEMTTTNGALSSQDDSERLIDEERWTLLRHDAHAFPVEPPPSLLDDKKDKKNKKKKKQKTATSSLPPETPLDYIPDRALNSAKDMIQAEMETLLQGKTQPLLAEGKTLETAKEAMNEATVDASKNSSSSKEVFVQDGWTKQTDESQIQSYALEFDTLQEATSALRKKNEKAESKTTIMTGGYSKRAQAISAEMLQMYGDMRNSIIEDAVYTDLQQKEERGGVLRIDRFRADIRKLQQDEAELQVTYQELTAKSQQSQELAET
jgi:hypothetical protein